MRCLNARLFTLLLLPLVLPCGCKKNAAPAQASLSPPPPAAPNGGGLQPPGVNPGVMSTLPSAGRVNPSNDLRQFYLYYKDYENGQKSPSCVEDLPELRRDMSSVYKAIQEGVYIVYWNAPVNAGGQTILAYVPDAPIKGGVVLLMDGSVANMTPEQFQAAPKAGK
ncbi:MAG: hypothetical protein ACYC3I_03760 [Gemmataceae bacterium]